MASGEAAAQAGAQAGARALGQEAVWRVQELGKRHEWPGCGVWGSEAGVGRKELPSAGRWAMAKSGHFDLGVTGRQRRAASRGRVLAVSFTLALVEPARSSAGETGAFQLPGERRRIQRQNWQRC